MTEEQEINQPEPEPTDREKYLQLLAESENTRKRISREKLESIRLAHESAIIEFLPAIDNFENALKSAETYSPEVKNWAIGFKMILSQLQEVLHNNGVIAFPSEGHLFDPLFHEAVEMVETEAVPEGTIMKEFTKGYKSHTRAIRPARVQVAKAAASEEELTIKE